MFLLTSGIRVYSAGGSRNISVTYNQVHLKVLLFHFIFQNCNFFLNFFPTLPALHRWYYWTLFPANSRNIHKPQYNVLSLWSFALFSGFPFTGYYIICQSKIQGNSESHPIRALYGMIRKTRTDKGIEVRYIFWGRSECF